jgi:hypothetical protein
MKYKIKFIICYFGQWPVWFDGFLLSCKYNKDIDWLLFTDCAIPKNHPSNVEFVKYSTKDFNQLASSKLNLDINVSWARKLCDFKVTYGCIFEDYLKGYDFWGMCDIDIIFGDIKNFVTNEWLNYYDVITTRIGKVAGHFTLFKNNSEVNNLFREERNYKNILEIEQKYCRLDEQKMSEILQENIDKYKVKWNEFLLNFPSKYCIDKKNHAPGDLKHDEGPWYWDKGKIFINKKEILYLHFMNWKNTIQNINFNYEDEVESFYIHYKGLCKV